MDRGSSNNDADTLLVCGDVRAQPEHIFKSPKALQHSYVQSNLDLSNNICQIDRRKTNSLAKPREHMT